MPTVLLVLLLAVAGGGPAPVDPARSGSISCRAVDVPVTLLGPQSVHGTLCVPSGQSGVVHLLVPGGSYNSSYWDLPDRPGLRSFRLAMNRAGYATLTVDRLGTGGSSKPPAAMLTALTQAEAMHQVVRRLRNGAFGTAFGQVIIGGHSLGAAIAVLEAALHHDVDGVLVAGLTHQPNLVNAGAHVFLNTYPAALDPKFAGEIRDPLYLTTRPGTRAAAFHNPATPTPVARATDEETKDVFTGGETVDGGTVGLVSLYTKRIDVPVLIAVSDGDPIMCSPLTAGCATSETLRRAESPHFSPAARLWAYVLPGGYGHAFNYAPNAEEFHEEVIRWANQLIGA